MHRYIIPFLVVTIGFTAEDYLATEGRDVNVCVEILEAGAALGRSIPFRVSTAAAADDDEGAGMCWQLLWSSLWCVYAFDHWSEYS